MSVQLEGSAELLQPRRKRTLDAGPIQRASLCNHPRQQLQRRVLKVNVAHADAAEQQNQGTFSLFASGLLRAGAGCLEGQGRASH